MTWTKETKEYVYRSLKRGVAKLENKEQLDMYNHAYGRMHKTKLNECFKTINDLHAELNAKDIQVIDYGCGQGLGSIVFIDFIKNYSINFTISQVTLIEPSEIALQKASKCANDCLKKIGQNQNILKISKTIDQLDSQDLSTKPKSIKFHILSNILDIDEFDIESLAQKIDSTIEGTNYFICVSPKFLEDGKSTRNLRIKSFMEGFQQKRNITVLSQRENDIIPWKNDAKCIKRYERIFKVVK